MRLNPGMQLFVVEPGQAGVIAGLAPESLQRSMGQAAVKAAHANKLQRSDNIVLGATLATIGLTVPGVLVASIFTGHKVELGLDNVGIFLLTVTLLVSMINASAGRTNILQGVIHLTLFAAFLVVIFV